MKSIQEAGDLTGKRVLVRVDWNIPRIKDTFRIERSLPTIELLQKAGAKVILATHSETVRTEALEKFVPQGAELLPNLRANPGEEANSEEFAKELASKADIYVNEAFSASHRSHASIVGVPKLLPHYAGLGFVNEVSNLSQAFNPPHPFLIILGGAKFETKLPLVNKFLNIADKIFIGGAMAVKASEMGLDENEKVELPLGDIAALDATPANMNLLREEISRAQFILWNGPLGRYEEGYTEGTDALARILAESGKQVMVGGADTLANVEELGFIDKFTFVSTGGGAMLDFLATGTLPGIEALERSSTGEPLKD